MELDARLQPHLGRVQDRGKPHLDMNMLAIAKVTRVWHQHGTVDLQLVKSNNTISSNDGKYSARMTTSSAHYNPDTGSSSGVVEPVQEGQMVLLAFIDGLKNQPVIIGSFHQTWEAENNVLPMHELEQELSIQDKRDAVKYLRVHPSQFYERVDGIGSMEISHPSKTFIQIDPDLYDEINDSHKGYDHHGLNERDPHTGEVRSGRSEEASYPVNILLMHRSSFDDEATTWTKLFINSSGMFRLTRDNNDGTLSFLQIEEEGAMKIRRQIDSPNHGEGSNYSEFEIEQEGGVSLKRVIDNESSFITVNNEGDIILQHKDGSFIKMDSKGISGDLSGGSGGIGHTVSPTEPTGTPDGHLWIDTSDI